MSTSYQVKVVDNCTSSTTECFELVSESTGKDLYRQVLKGLTLEEDLSLFYITNYEDRKFVMRSVYMMCSIVVEKLL
jgi:hypothetical protein